MYLVLHGREIYYAILRKSVDWQYLRSNRVMEKIM